MSEVEKPRSDTSQPWHTREELSFELNDVELTVEKLLGSMHGVEEACSDSMSDEWHNEIMRIGDLFLKTDGQSLTDRTRRAAGLEIKS